MQIITSHTNSDFDSLGAMIGAHKLYPEAKCVFPGSQERTLRRFFIEASTYATDFHRVRDINLDEVTQLIIVDTDGASRIGPFATLLGRDGVKVHVYDHHPESPHPIEAEFKVQERVGAATTILTELIRDKRIPLDGAEATIMLLGIFEDTGGLTFTSTTPRDFAAAGYLLGQGADLATVREFVTPELTAKQVALLDELLKTRIVHNIHSVKVSEAWAQSGEYIGDMAMLAHKMCDMENIDALVAYALMNDRIHMVCRSRIPEVDGALIARHFGGGGHPEAASATIKDMTPIQVHEELAVLLPKVVKPRLAARDLLSSPPKILESGSTIAQARTLLNRYHINAVPVVEPAGHAEDVHGGSPSKVLGIITRLVTERAASHGLENAPADDYMYTDFRSVSPSSPLEKVREIIVDGNQRLVPVMEDGQLLGVISRTDLLHALMPADKPEPVAHDRVAVRNVRRIITELIEPDVVERLKTLGEAAEAMGMRAYLVGGMVRDLMLRQANLDVDVVVEGDAMEVARRLARKWDASVHLHRTFGTAKLKLKEGLEIDVATARTEYYEQPAALPTVEQSSLKLDLSRRDFTINALAMRLEPDRFGEIIDFFGGMQDLKGRTIRILHNLSFVEDPTRVMRAIRFAERFGFELGGQTRRLLKSSIEEGFLARAKGPRLFREWRMLLEEAEPVSATERLMDEGVLEVFHPKIVFDDKARALFNSIGEVESWYELSYLEPPFESWRLYVLALLEALDNEELKAFFKGFSVHESVSSWFMRARAGSSHVLAALRKAGRADGPTDSEIYRACEHADGDTLLYAMSRTRDSGKRRSISRYYTRLSAVETYLKGEDLKRMGIAPGPVYRKILDALLDARLDGAVRTREDELRYVRTQWGGIIE